MGELMNDEYCLTCLHAKISNEYEQGLPVSVKCSLKDEEMSIDDRCEQYE